MSESISKYQPDERIEVANEKDTNELSTTYEIEPKDEKAVLRKLDRVILPLMALVYFFQYEYIPAMVIVCNSRFRRSRQAKY
jgi:hypothetical protein